MPIKRHLIYRVMNSITPYRKAYQNLTMDWALQNESPALRKLCYDGGVFVTEGAFTTYFDMIDDNIGIRGNGVIVRES